MTADDARAALAALDAAGACGAPTLRSALEALIKIDAAVRADLAAEHELDERHTERLDVRADVDATPDDRSAADEAYTLAVMHRTRTRTRLAMLLSSGDAR